MDKSPDNEVQFRATLAETRKRRMHFFVTVLSYLPALYGTYTVSPTHKSMGTLFGVWLVILLVVTFRLAVSRCPQCGNLFHVHGMTLLVLRKCLHCQFHIKGDRTSH